MEKLMITEAEMEQAVALTLPQIGADAADFGQMRSTFLSSEPAWPGTEWHPAASAQFALFIDHTMLGPTATDVQVEQLCAEAEAHGFATVCVNSCHVRTCVERLKNTDVKVCSVVGFPLGAMATEAKAGEAQFAADCGAHEIDMVMNIGRFLSGPEGLLYAFRDMTAVRQAAWGCGVKVILETALLSPQQIVEACVVSVMAGANFVKTSTGFSKGGAKPEDVALMRRVVGGNIGVKASGGVRDAGAALEMIRAGANRIGTSSGVAIVAGDTSPVGSGY